MLKNSPFSAHFVLWILMSLFPAAVNGQSVVADSSCNIITNSLIKRCMMKSMLRVTNRKLDIQFENDFSPYFLYYIPGLSYIDYVDLFKIEPFLSKDYCVKDERLFKVSIEKNIRYDSVRSIDDGVELFSIHKYALVSLNKNNEFKCLSGCFIDDDIINEFKIRKNNPKTYIPYLRVKFAYREFDKIKFEKKVADKYYYIAQIVTSDETRNFSLSFDVNKPQKVDIKFVSAVELNRNNDSDTISSQINKTPLNKTLLLVNEPYESKRNFILNQLSKNIYLYKIAHEKDIYNKLYLDTTTWLVNGKSIYWDSLLPDCNEIIDNMDIITMYDKEFDCDDTAPKFYQWRYDPVKRLAIATSLFEGVEFYRIWKDTATVLCKNADATINSFKNCRYDYYYLPKLKKDAQTYSSSCDECPLIPEEMVDFPPFYKGNPKCQPYDIWQDTPSEGRVDYYMLALDVKRNKIYFLSGKDIFTNNATHLYKGLEYDDGYTDFPSLMHKLAYIQDRLYRYQIKEVTKENILREDEKSMTLLLKGRERGIDINLEVTLQYDNPELLRIKSIDN